MSRQAGRDTLYRPRSFITIKESHNTFTAADPNGHTLFEAGELKAVLDWMNESFRIKTPELDIPFSGGAVGYLSYDMIPLIEPSVPSHAKETDFEKCMLFVCRKIIAYDHETKQVHFIQYAELNGRETEEEKRAVFKENCAELRVYRYFDRIERYERAVFSKETFDTPSFADVTSNYTKEEFMAGVNKLKEYIKAGDIFQGCFRKSLTFRYPDIHLSCTGCSASSILHPICTISNCLTETLSGVRLNV